MENNLISDASYRKPANPEHQDNPLLEALFDLLPPKDFFKKITAEGPKSRNEILTLSEEIRPQYLDSLRRKFLIPNRRLYSVYELIHSSINSSYILRNPLNRSIKKQLRKDYRDLDALPQSRGISTFSKSSMLIGVSGIGKTTAINAACIMFPPGLKHKDIKGESFIQVPIVKLECPKDGSIKDFCRYFFIELDRILGTRYESAYCKSRDTANDRVIAMSKLVAAHCIGIIIVDEIQHLIQSKGGLSETMLNFFLNLDNTIHIPILIVGTPEALELFSSKQRLRRRFTAGAALKWDRLPNDLEWSIIIKHLLKYQYTHDVANAETSWKEIFYFHSQGIIDRAIKIFVAAQQWAFSIGATSITPEIIETVVDETMWLDNEVFKSLRSRKLVTNEFSDMILPSSNSDLQNNYRLINIQSELEDFDIPENFSFPLIEQINQTNPTLSDNEIAFQIIKAYRDSQKNETNHASKEEPLVPNYVEGDLRKLNTTDETLLHEQLVELGLIVNLESFMIN